MATRADVVASETAGAALRRAFQGEAVALAAKMPAQLLADAALRPAIVVCHARDGSSHLFLGGANDESVEVARNTIPSEPLLIALARWLAEGVRLLPPAAVAALSESTGARVSFDVQTQQLVCYVERGGMTVLLFGEEVEPDPVRPLPGYDA